MNSTTVKLMVQVFVSALTRFGRRWKVNITLHIHALWWIMQSHEKARSRDVWLSTAEAEYIAMTSATRNQSGFLVSPEHSLRCVLVPRKQDPH